MNNGRVVKIPVEFFENQYGVASIEYALLAALIIGAIVASIGFLGESVEALYGDVASKVGAAAP